MIVVPGLMWAAVASGAECVRLQVRWKTGNYGFSGSARWPRRPSGLQLSMFEVDAMLGGLKGEIERRYRALSTGELPVSPLETETFGELLDRLEELRDQGDSAAHPEIEGRIWEARGILQAALSEIAEELAPLRARHRELVELSAQAKEEMRSFLDTECGGAVGGGFQFSNGGALPKVPRLTIPRLPDWLAFSHALSLQAGVAFVWWPPGHGVSGVATLAAVAFYAWVGAPSAVDAALAEEPRSGVGGFSWEEDAWPLTAGPSRAFSAKEGFWGSGSGFHSTLLEKIAAADSDPPGGEMAGGVTLGDQVPEMSEDRASSVRRPARDGSGTQQKSSPTFAEKGDRRGDDSSKSAGSASGRLLFWQRFIRGLGGVRRRGSWAVENFALRARGSLDYPGESLYLFGEEAWRNYKIELDFLLEGGEFETGLLLRSQSEENTYVLRIRGELAPGKAYHQAVDLVLRSGGRVRRVVCGTERRIPVNQWIRLAVRVEWSRFQLFLDGLEVLDCWDDNLETGGASLRLAGRTEARFDNIVVREIPVAGSPWRERGAKGGSLLREREGWSRSGGRFDLEDGLVQGLAASREPVWFFRPVSASRGPYSVAIRVVGAAGGGGLFLGQGQRMVAAVVVPGAEPDRGRFRILVRREGKWEPVLTRAVPVVRHQWVRIEAEIAQGALIVKIDDKVLARWVGPLARIERVGILAYGRGRLLADTLVGPKP